MSATVTQWFDEDIKPVHIGVYERDYMNFDEPTYSYWDGSGFYVGFATPEDARCFGVVLGKSQNQHERWRGLAEKP